MVHYTDASALAKLVLAEPESDALRSWIAQHGAELASSDLSRTELLRAARRADAHAVERARAVLDGLLLVSLPASVFTTAGLLQPELLRSLDAIHLAAALCLGDDLESFVTYDDRQAEAARSVGVRVTAPH